MSWIFFDAQDHHRLLFDSPIPSLGYWSRFPLEFCPPLPFAHWRDDASRTRRQAKALIWVSAIGLVSLASIPFIGKDFKFLIIEGMTGWLGIAGYFAALFSAGMLWYYGQKRHWPFFALTLVALLLSIGAAQHFFRQSTNAKHVSCPDCSGDDEDDHDSESSLF